MEKTPMASTSTRPPEQLVAAYVAQEQPTTPGEPDEPARVLQVILEEIYSARLTLINLVKASGPALTNEADDTRRKGVKMLGGVVQGLAGFQDGRLLARGEVRVLTDFFTDKLADTSPIALEAITALSSLTASPAFGVGETVQICKALFKHISMTKLTQAGRLSIFMLIDCLMARQRRGLKRMGNDFLVGYCALAEGEKDPRNLMVAFKLAKVILTEFEIAGKIEDLFDITFCYFPITFRASPNDPYSITSEDLQLALRECLSATPRFGLLALPLFLDKLQAASNNAKKQSLEALIACFPVYGKAVTAEFSLTFWEAFAVEVFHATETEMKDLALSAIKVLFCTIYPPTETKDTFSTTESLIERLLSAILPELADPSKAKAQSASSIVSAVLLSGASTKIVGRRVVEQSVELLLELWRRPEDMGKRSGVLEQLGTILSGLAEFVRSAGAAENAELPSPPILYSSKDELLGIVVSGAQAESSKLQGIEAVVQLCLVPGLLEPDEVKYAIGALNEALTGMDEDTSDVALDGLAAIAVTRPSVIEEITLPLIFASLPDVAPSPSEKKPYFRSLASLATLCDRPRLFEPLVVRLLARVENICALSILDTPTRTANILYAHHILVTLRVVIAAKVKAGHKDLAGYFDRTGPRLLAIFVLPSVEGDSGKEKVAVEPRLMVDAGKVLNLLVQQLDLDRQNQLSLDLHACFSKGHLKPLLANEVRHFTPQLDLLPMQPQAPDYQRNTLILFSAAVVAFRQEVHVPDEKLSRFSHAFLLRSVSAATPLQTTASLQLLCSTVNRRAQDFPDFFSMELPAFWADAIAPANGQSTVSRHTALQLWSWITKALVVRSDSRGYECIEKLLGLFGDPESGKDAARCLGIIMEEGDEVLSKENFAVVRLLWKQRFFNYMLPRIFDGYSTHTGPEQSIYLIALASILKNVPSHLSLPALPKLMPLLLKALGLPDDDLRANILESLVVLAEDDKAASAIADHAEVLVSVLLDNAMTRNGKERPTSVKAAALQLLGLLPSSVPYTSLHAQKTHVIKSLGIALDDRSKAVRKEAVDCRAKWYAYRSSA